MKPACICFGQYLAAHREWLLKAIEENKWYLSEQAGRDVGWDIARQHFYENYLDEVSSAFRRQYCAAACRQQGGCSSREAATALPSLAERQRQQRERR